MTLNSGKGQHTKELYHLQKCVFFLANRNVKLGSRDLNGFPFKNRAVQ